MAAVARNPFGITLSPGSGHVIGGGDRMQIAAVGENIMVTSCARERVAERSAALRRT